MAMKGSDEGTPPIYGGRECSGGWFQFLFRGNFGHYHEQFSKELKKIARHKRRGIFSMSEKDFISFSNTTRK